MFLTFLYTILCTLSIANKPNVRNQLTNQIKQSNSQIAQYTKTVRMESKDETKQFNTVNLVNETLASDFKYFTDENLVKNYALEQKDNIINAKLISPNLILPQNQSVVLSPDGKSILEFNSNATNSNWLFETSLLIQIKFDAEGKYLEHKLVNTTKIKLMDITQTTTILGKATYR